MISGGLPSSQQSRYKVTGLENNLHRTQGSKEWRFTAVMRETWQNTSLLYLTLLEEIG